MGSCGNLINDELEELMHNLFDMDSLYEDSKGGFVNNKEHIERSISLEVEPRNL
jgi:hypothetical protein